MNQEFSVSWSGDSSGMPIGPKPDDELVVLAPFTRYPLPERKLLLIRSGDFARVELAQDAFELLERCSMMRTLDDHVAAICAELPHLAQASGAVRELLSGARRSGLLISSRHIERALSAQPDDASADVPTVVCIGTCDRPALLERVLESALTGLPSGGMPSYNVIDDSRDPANGTRNRVLAQDAASRLGVPLRYVGPDEQHALMAHLVQALPASVESIDFLFGRSPNYQIPSHGRVWNYALLLSYGKTLVYVDDDAVCRAYPAPLPLSQSIRFNPVSRDAVFFGAEEERDAHCAGGGSNPLPILSRFTGVGMGHAVAALSRSAGFNASFDGITSEDADALLSGKTRVAVTACGVFGDPGTMTPAGLFDLSGDSWRRFSGNEARYRTALRERNLWRGQSGYRFTRNHSLLSVVKAIDHRLPLTPFFPLFRNEDYLFGRLLPLVDQDAWFMEFPWAVPHLPDPRRQWPPSVLEEAALLGFSRFTGLYLSHRILPPLSTKIGDRLKVLGSQFMDMGEGDPARIREEMVNCLRFVLSDRIQRLDQRMQTEQQMPSWLKHDVAQMIDVNQRALLEAREPHIYDLMEHGQGQDPAVWAMDLWRQYGTALQAWPEILSAAPAQIGGLDAA